MKKETIKFWQSEIENTEKQISELEVLPKDVQDLYDAYIKARNDHCNSLKPKKDSLQNYIYECRGKITEIRNNNKPFELTQDLKNWLRQYQSGVNFGYGGLKFAYIHPSNQYAIITNPGGTAGTGTAMGTGGYYYARTEHWVVKIENGKTWKDGNRALEIYGKLSKKLKDLCIQYMDECISSERKFNSSDDITKIYSEAFTPEEALAIKY